MIMFLFFIMNIFSLVLSIMSLRAEGHNTSAFLSAEKIDIKLGEVL